MKRNNLQTISDAVSTLANAVNDRGGDPAYHSQWLTRLAEEWPSLARGVADVLHTVGEDVPQEWQRLI